jgi:hypothetical protein
MKELIEDYKRRLKTAEEMINGSGYQEQNKKEAVKISCYREFISELERLSAIELPTDEEIEKEFTIDEDYEYLIPELKDEVRMKMTNRRIGAKRIRDLIRDRRGK